MSDDIKHTVRRINEKWRRVRPSSFWGDRLDVRYYACWAFKSIQGKRVLDIGCGTGIVLSELDPSNRRFGMDVSEEHIKTAGSIDAGAKFVRADMLNVPFKDGSFDVVMLNAMLPLIEDRGAFIAQIGRLLKERGKLFIVTHNRLHHMYRKSESLMCQEEMADLLKESFDFKITGFNPLPAFPFFLPNAVADKVPFIWGVIAFFASRNILSSRCRGMFVEAVKRAAQ